MSDSSHDSAEYEAYSYFLPQGLGLGFDGDESKSFNVPSLQTPTTPESSSPSTDSFFATSFSQRFKNGPVLFSPLPFTSSFNGSSSMHSWNSGSNGLSQTSSSDASAVKSVLSVKSKVFVPRTAYIDSSSKLFSPHEEGVRLKPRRQLRPNQKPFNSRPPVHTVFPGSRKPRFRDPPTHKSQRPMNYPLTYQTSNNWKAKTIAVASSVESNVSSPALNMAMKGRNWVPKDKVWKPILPRSDSEDDNMLTPPQYSDIACGPETSQHHGHESAIEGSQEGEMNAGESPDREQSASDHEGNCSEVNITEEEDECCQHEEEEEEEEELSEQVQSDSYYSEFHEELFEEGQRVEGDGDVEPTSQDYIDDEHEAEDDQVSAEGLEDSLVESDQDVNSETISETFDTQLPMETSADRSFQESSASSHPLLEERIVESNRTDEATVADLKVVERTSSVGNSFQSPQTTQNVNNKHSVKEKNKIQTHNTKESRKLVPSTGKRGQKSVKYDDTNAKGVPETLSTNKSVSIPLDLSKHLEISSKVDSKSLTPEKRSISTGIVSRLFSLVETILFGTMSYAMHLHLRAWQSFVSDHNIMFCYLFMLFFPSLSVTLAGWTPHWLPHCLWISFVIHSFCREGPSWIVSLLRILLPLSFVVNGVHYDCILFHLNLSERIVVAFFACGFRNSDFFRAVYLQCLSVQILFSVSYGTNIVVQWIMLILSLSVINISDRKPKGAHESVRCGDIPSSKEVEDHHEVPAKGPPLLKPRRRLNRKTR